MFFQYLASFSQCRVRVFGDGGSDFLFVRCQFGVVMDRSLFGSNVTGFSALLEETVNPRRADRKMLSNVVDGIAFIVRLKDSFA